MRTFAAFLFILAVVPLHAGCGDKTEYADLVPEAERVALRFTELLAGRNYHSAYRMCSRELKAQMDRGAMIEGFEAIVPPDWGPVEPVTIVRTMNDWSDRRLGDVVWAYVSIYGDVYSEAVTMVVTYEDERLRIRGLEFGRP